MAASSINQVTRQAPESATLIFVVDDNALLGNYARMVLQADGYEVQSFTDPRDVLAALKLANPKPVALVTDYDMGPINGLDLIVSSHSLHPALKTFLVSGTVNSAIGVGHPAKVDGFLAKPYQPAQLKSMVSAALQA